MMPPPAMSYSSTTTNRPVISDVEDRSKAIGAFMRKVISAT
jgi:hypothetical protein